MKARDSKQPKLPPCNLCVHLLFSSNTSSCGLASIVCHALMVVDEIVEVKDKRSRRELVTKTGNQITHIVILSLGIVIATDIVTS